VLWREGPAAGGPILATGYLRGDPSLSVPDLHLQFTALGYRRNARNQVALGDEPAITTIINVCKPEARGRVTLSSPDPLAPFDGRLQLLGRERDVACLVRGLRVVRRIHSAAPLASVMRDEFLPGPACTSDAQLEAYCRESVSGQYHPVGTCRMGADGASVVDPVLRVRGLAGLRVADASVMPTITSANTMAPVMMIAEKAADLILGPGAPPT
jgi:choline dehydrogenase